MNRPGKKVHNRKLFRLRHDYIYVHTEMEEMNRFFQRHIGYNLVHFFVLRVLTTFSCLFADIRMAVGVLMIILVMYICVIYIPFQQANRAPIAVGVLLYSLTVGRVLWVTNEITKPGLSQVGRVRRQFEKISFRRSVNQRIKHKIDSLGNLGDRAGLYGGFSCFD